MDFSLDPKQDEERIAQRELYRPGQAKPAAKPASKPTLPASAPSIAKPTSVKSKLTVPGKSGKPSPWKRYGRALLVLLALLGLGGVSYCIFRPNRVKDAAKGLHGVFKDPTMTWEQRKEKMGQITSRLNDTEKKQLRDAMRKQMQHRDRKRTSEFFKLSPEEQVAKMKKDIVEGEKRRAEWQARRAASGGGGRGGRPGGTGGGGNRPAAGTGGQGGAGGAAGGAAGAGAGNRGGAGGPGGGGAQAAGGPGGPRGRGGDSNLRAKNRLDRSDPEYRAQKTYMRTTQSQVRQQMGLPPGGRGFGGGPPRGR